MTMHLETRAIHAPAAELTGSRPVSVPIYQSSVFAFDDAAACARALDDPGAGFAYSRYANPTTAALEAVAAESADSTSRRWRYKDGAGEIGVIASVTQPFCGGCSRARLSAEGRLYTCLFAARGHDLRAPLRLGASDEELVEQLRGVWTRRTDRYSELRTAETASLPKIEMSYIGG